LSRFFKNSVEVLKVFPQGSQGFPRFLSRFPKVFVEVLKAALPEAGGRAGRRVAQGIVKVLSRLTENRSRATPQAVFSKPVLGIALAFQGANLVPFIVAIPRPL
jgi:hypothetical protein